MEFLIYILRLFALLFTLGGLVGCGVAEPTTEIKYSPVWGFSLTNSKDVVAGVKKATFNAETKEFTVEDLHVSDNASSVRLANVEQLKLVNEQIRIHGENIAQSLGLITAMAEKVIPGFQVPRGGSSGGGLEGVIERAVAGYIESKLSKPAPASQPSP